MPRVETAVVPLGADDAAFTSHMLARAFFDDPLNVWLLPDERHRAAVLPGVFEAIVRGSVLFEASWTTADSILGSANWLPPGVIETTPEQNAATGLDAALAAVGDQASARAALAFPFLGSLRARGMPEDHWYLGLLGVEPIHQGLGIGGQLIAPGLALADAAAAPCYLETIRERNVPFYRAHGFRLLETGELPGDGPRYWTLRRDARA
jgi:GNAT superfamily N-acetyltransferase